MREMEAKVKKEMPATKAGGRRKARRRHGAAALLTRARADLALAFSRLQTPEDMERAFVDFFTASELRDLQARWLIFKMLEDGVTQREISRILGVSLCKITRGSRFLKSPKTIVRKMLDEVAGRTAMASTDVEKTGKRRKSK